LIRKKGLYALFISFLFFWILAKSRFFIDGTIVLRHNLDPNAAIQVPECPYQPPLLGYKQLLNFGAYSIPDTGGWMLIAADYYCSSRGNQRN
jgi:copper chaperone NosL